MDQSVTIKGVKSGIVLKLSGEEEFESLLAVIREKFDASASFFGSAKMVLSIEGRQLSEDEVKQVLDIIHEKTKLHIVAVVTEDSEQDDKFSEILEAWEKEREESGDKEGDAEEYEDADTSYAEIHIGTLRNGFSYETENSLLILGNVNRGAEVTAGGSIFVFGNMFGIANAGCMGDEKAFVMATRLEPLQIRISDRIAISEDVSPEEKEGVIPLTMRGVDNGPEVALISDGHIVIKKYDRNFLESTTFTKE